MIALVKKDEKTVTSTGQNFIHTKLVSCTVRIFE